VSQLACVDLHSVLFHYYSPEGDTARPGGLHARLYHAFLVVLEYDFCGFAKM